MDYLGKGVPYQSAYQYRYKKSAQNLRESFMGLKSLESFNSICEKLQLRQKCCIYIFFAFKAIKWLLLKNAVKKGLDIMKSRT